MIVPVEEGPRAVIVAPKGEVDMGTSPVLRRHLKAASERKKAVVVVLRDVEYMDSSGLAVLIEAFQWSQKAKIGFALADLSTPVRDVVELALLESVFKIYPDLDAALAAL